MNYKIFPLLILFLLCLDGYGQTKYDFHRSLKAEPKEKEEGPVNDLQEGAESSSDAAGEEFKALLEGIQNLPGGTIIPVLKAGYSGKIRFERWSVFAEIYVADDLALEGDTLQTPEVRSALSQSYFVPEASLVRFSFGTVWSPGNLNLVSQNKKGSRPSKGNDENGKWNYLVSFNLDVMAKRIGEMISDSTLAQKSIGVVGLTAGHGINLVGDGDFRLFAYNDLGLMVTASESMRFRNYFDEPDDQLLGSGRRVSLVPKIGILTSFKNTITVDLGYIFATKSVNNLLRGDDFGFFVVKAGISTGNFIGKG